MKINKKQLAIELLRTREYEELEKFVDNVGGDRSLACRAFRSLKARILNVMRRIKLKKRMRLYRYLRATMPAFAKGFTSL